MFNQHTPLKNVFIKNICLHKYNTKHYIKIWFDVKHSFNDHIHFIRNKAFAKLGFFKCTCAHFRDEFALKTICQSIVHSCLDYALLIHPYWHPYLKTNIQSLEKIQNNYIRFLCFQCIIIKTPHSYER